MDTKYLLNKIADKKNLNSKETSFLLEEIIEGRLNSTQVAAFLVSLRTKGETIDEIVALIQTMRKHMSKVAAKGNVIDIVGTGGDGAGTFNISTASSFVVAGAGVKVIKHGNRAASSKCGSADVLEELGVNINLTPTAASNLLKKAGMVFLFAPLFHPAMKNIAPVRKELGIRTVFNFLGPFLNPASTKKQLLGVPNLETAKKLAQVASKLKFSHLIIATSQDGLDEITTTSNTRIFEIKKGKLKTYTISPKQFGISPSTKKDLLGNDATENAKIIRRILNGEKGPKRNIIILNSAFALYLAGTVNKIKSGITLAEESIDSGQALKVLNDLILESKKYA